MSISRGATFCADWRQFIYGIDEDLILSEHDTRAEPSGHVAACSVPLVGGAFLWGGKVYR